MADVFFPVSGTDVPPMFGRSAIMERVWNDLTKKTPSHLSIVGPRYIGKTVFINDLAEKIRIADSPYTVVVIWDLGHQTPESNELFLKALCRKLGKGLQECGNEYGEHLLAVDEDEYNELREVLEALHGDGGKVLMLWDGFDKPLSKGKLTRNLWDQLRELASYPSLRLVTATRQPLAELISTEESVTSDFWNIFDPSLVRIGPFDDSDRAAIFVKLQDVTFNSGAKSELENWSAGYPPLYLTLINRIMVSGPFKEVDNHTVNQAAEEVTEDLKGRLSYLWSDCSESAKNLYLHVVEQGEINKVGVGKDDLSILGTRGFIRESGNKISKGCRFLEYYVRSLKDDIGSMFRLFGSWDGYCKNIRSFLESRLAQIIRFDDRLPRYIEFSIQRLPENPEAALNDLTSIEERALDLIWEKEFGSMSRVPTDVISYWTTPPRDQNNLVKEMMSKNSFDVPFDRFKQIRLLQLLTGSLMGDFHSKAKAVTKDSYVLLNAIHSFRNRNQHGEGQRVHLGVAVAGIITCIELFACLERELAE